MKKSLLSIIICSYSFIIIKPLIPDIADTIAHVFWYSEHMATVHYENGKYHVHYEIQRASREGNSEKDANIVKSGFSDEYLMPSENNEPYIISTNKINFFTSSSSLFFHSLTGDFRPPKS